MSRCQSVILTCTVSILRRKVWVLLSDWAKATWESALTFFRFVHSRIEISSRFHRNLNINWISLKFRSLRIWAIQKSTKRKFISVQGSRCRVTWTKYSNFFWTKVLAPAWPVSYFSLNFPRIWSEISEKIWGYFLHFSKKLASCKLTKVWRYRTSSLSSTEGSDFPAKMTWLVVDTAGGFLRGSPHAANGQTIRHRI